MDITIDFPEDKLSQLIEKAVAAAFEKHSQAAPASAPATKESYTSKELQELFNVSATTIWNWEKAGTLQPVIVGRKKMYPGAHIANLISTNTLKQRQ